MPQGMIVLTIDGHEEARVISYRVTEHYAVIMSELDMPSGEALPGFAVLEDTLSKQGDYETLRVKKGDYTYRCVIPGCCALAASDFLDAAMKKMLADILKTSKGVPLDDIPF